MDIKSINDLVVHNVICYLKKTDDIVNHLQICEKCGTPLYFKYRYAHSSEYGVYRRCLNMVKGCTSYKCAKCEKTNEPRFRSIPDYGDGYCSVKCLHDLYD